MHKNIVQKIHKSIVTVLRAILIKIVALQLNSCFKIEVKTVQRGFLKHNDIIIRNNIIQMEVEKQI